MIAILGHPGTGRRLSLDRAQFGLRVVYERDFVATWVYEVHRLPEGNGWKGAGRVG
jgi:hypothetical protein